MTSEASQPWEGDENTPDFDENIPNFDGKHGVTVAAGYLRELSEPSRRGDPVKAAIARAAKLTGLSYWRAFDIWYSKARRIEPFEADQISDALKKQRRTAARNEFHELRTRMLRLEALLARSDPDFHRETIDQTRHRLREMDGSGGAPARAVARRT